ncbi:pyocin activator PrtN family protein [Aureimonas mangrovi]|uniref:pyocin activator PrtN family protein n=1 Tax=Aureimonas mangrovi TaxID=2758041 RepID=UPI00163DB69D
MKTLFLLMARYDALPVIPIATVAADFFPHLGTQKLLRKIGAGEIALPLTRIEGSAKAAKGVYLQDLAAYIDVQAEAARKECRQLNGTAPAAYCTDRCTMASRLDGKLRLER